MSALRFLLLLACFYLAVSATQIAYAADVTQSTRNKPTEPVLALFREARKRFTEKDFAGGEREMSAVINKDPKFAEAYYARACNRHMLHDLDGALSDCNQAITLEPNGNPIFYFERAVTEYRLKKLDECIRDCDVAVKRAPDFPESYFIRARAKADKGDNKGALDDCEAYLRKRPLNQKAIELKKRILAGS